MRRLNVAAMLAGGIALGAALGAGVPLAAQRIGGYQGTPEDFMQISQLFSLYSYTIDNHDGVAWADTFAPDGVFQDPSWCAKGRDELIKIVGRNPEMGHDILSHHTPELGPIFYQDRDHAAVRSTLVTYRQRGPGKPDGGVNMTGVYEDKLVRVNGRWLFAHRTVDRLSATPSIACSAKP